jgi:hypothetical protein
MKNDKPKRVLAIISFIIFGILVNIQTSAANTDTYHSEKGMMLAMEDTLVISGIIDASLSGGLPKAVELYAVTDIDDLSLYGIGVNNSGGGSDGEEFSFPNDAISAGTFIYVTLEQTSFNSWFGFNADYTSFFINFDGDDAVELFKNDTTVVDVFGDVDVDGTGQNWEYTDGWVYRFCGTGPDSATFVENNWIYSGLGSLIGETSNSTAATPFPIATYETMNCPDLPCSVLANEMVSACDSNSNNFALSITPIVQSGGSQYYYVLDGGMQQGPFDYGIVQFVDSFSSDGSTVYEIIVFDSDSLGCADTVMVTAPTACASAGAGDLVLTGIIDGPLSGGLPKAIELFAISDIPDLSVYGVGVANNGGGTDGVEFTFPSDAILAGTYIYLATESTGFSNWFGFAPDYISSIGAGVSGDDAVELFLNSTVVDVFGDISQDGSGQPWEYTDGWAYRNCGTGPDGTTFFISNWQFSGIDALDGESSNTTAATPFPSATYLNEGCGGCNLTLNAYAGTCNTDDNTFELIINPTVIEGGSQYFYSLNGGMQEGPFDYGMALPIDTLDSDGTSLYEIIVSDADSSACSDTAYVTAPDSCVGICSDLIITGVLDATLPNGLPKAIELYAIADIDDLSDYSLGFATNGNASGGIAYTFPSDSLDAGEFIYISKDSSSFAQWFGYNADYISGVLNFNGDDVIEVYCTDYNFVIDVFGEEGVDGTNQPWEYTDGWAYRNCGTGPDGSAFELSNWYFSFPNALDGELSNATAMTPFPDASYERTGCNPIPCTNFLNVYTTVCDPFTDSFAISISALASNGDTSYTYTVDGGTVNGPVFYGDTIDLGYFVSDSSLIQIIITDLDSMNCMDTAWVQSPGTCLYDSSIACNTLVITGIIDGPLPQGTPKAIEFFALEDIPDLSVYGIGTANNGEGSDGVEYNFPADSIPAGTYIYLATDSIQFNAFFGFYPTYTDGAVGINGNDAVELFCQGVEADVFGDIIYPSGQNQDWYYIDGWAYRNCSTGPDGTTFLFDNWTYSGTQVWDTATTNATATVPFPIATYLDTCPPLCVDTLVISGPIMVKGDYQAAQLIRTVGVVTIDSAAVFDALGILLDLEFEVPLGAEFETRQIGCNDGSRIPDNEGDHEDERKREVFVIIKNEIE